MRHGRRVGVVGLVLLLPLAALAAKPKGCVSPEEAANHLNQEVCVSAHVYDVVQLPNGTRFLDTCRPDQADSDCRFTLMSLQEDQGDVGDLRKYRDQNVQVRGIVRPLRGRAGVVISHSRQFTGGPEKFRPNPLLVRGFNGQTARAPIHDPNLTASAHARAWMNPRDTESAPARAK